MTRPPLGHVRDTVLELPEYDLKILLNGYPAHSARCRRASAQRDRIRQPDYDPSDRVRNERLDVVCDCGTDRRYTCYLEDQLQALRAQVPAAAGNDALAREVHAAWRDGMLNQGRDVAPHRMTWDTLSPEDHALDAYIAQRVAGAALRAQAEACQDTTDYDNAVTETVCDRLLEAITGQGEPSFGGPRLNMIVRLIRDLRAQAEANASLRAALDAAIQCEQDVVDAYGRGAPMVVLDEAVADLKRDSLPHLKRARAALGGQS